MQTRVIVTSEEEGTVSLIHLPVTFTKPPVLSICLLCQDSDTTVPLWGQTEGEQSPPAITSTPSSLSIHTD